MEVTLAVPLLFFLARYRLRIFRWSPLHGLLYGLLAAAVVLARLDATLFTILLGTLDLTLSTAPSAFLHASTRAPGSLPCFFAFSPLRMFFARTSLPGCTLTAGAMPSSTRPRTCPHLPPVTQALTPWATALGGSAICCPRP